VTAGLIKHAVRHVARLAVVIEPTSALARLRALPPWRGVARAEGVPLVEARRPVPRHAEATRAARGFFHLYVGLRQFIKEARGHGRGPHAPDAPIGGEVDLRKLARAGQANMGEAALFLKAGAAALVERALMRKQAFL